MMWRDARGFLSRRSLREKLVGGAVLLWVLLLAGVGLYHSWQVWAALLAGLCLLAVCAFGVYHLLRYLQWQKRGEYLKRISEFLYTFLHENSGLPIPVKPYRSAEEVKETADIFYQRLVAAATVNLLLRNTAAVRDPEHNSGLVREWLIQYAKEYGKRHNLRGYDQFPYFYPVSVTVLDNYLQISFVLVEGWLGAQHIRDKPLPQMPDAEQYKDEEFL